MSTTTGASVGVESAHSGNDSNTTAAYNGSASTSPPTHTPPQHTSSNNTPPQTRPPSHTSSNSTPTHTPPQHSTTNNDTLHVAPTRIGTQKRSPVPKPPGPQLTHTGSTKVNDSTRVLDTHNNTAHTHSPSGQHSSIQSSQSGQHSSTIPSSNQHSTHPRVPPPPGNVPSSSNTKPTTAFVGRGGAIAPTNAAPLFLQQGGPTFDPLAIPTSFPTKRKIQTLDLKPVATPTTQVSTVSAVSTPSPTHSAKTSAKKPKSKKRVQPKKQELEELRRRRPDLFEIEEEDEVDYSPDDISENLEDIKALFQTELDSKYYQCKDNSPVIVLQVAIRPSRQKNEPYNDISDQVLHKSPHSYKMRFRTKGINDDVDIMDKITLRIIPVSEEGSVSGTGLRIKKKLSTLSSDSSRKVRDATEENDLPILPRGVRSDVYQILFETTCKLANSPDGFRLEVSNTDNSELLYCSDPFMLYSRRSEKQSRKEHEILKERHELLQKNQEEAMRKREREEIEKQRQREAVQKKKLERLDEIDKELKRLRETKRIDDKPSRKRPISHLEEESTKRKRTRVSSSFSPRLVIPRNQRPSAPIQLYCCAKCGKMEPSQESQLTRLSFLAIAADIRLKNKSA